MNRALARALVIVAAHRWWESKRPLRMDEGEHLANPRINLSTDAEMFLAEAVAQYAASTQYLSTQDKEVPMATKMATKLKRVAGKVKGNIGKAKGRGRTALTRKKAGNSPKLARRKVGLATKARATAGKATRKRKLTAHAGDVIAVT